MIRSGVDLKDLDFKKKYFRDGFNIEVDQIFSKSFPISEISEGIYDLKVVDISKVDYYGPYEGNKKFTLTFETDGGFVVQKDFYLIDGAAYELAYLLGELVEDYDEKKFNLKDLLGRMVRAYVTFSYQNDGTIKYNISNYSYVE